MSFQDQYVFEVEDRFAELMVKPKVKDYHRHPALHNNRMKYNRWNNLPIHWYQLPHSQQWMTSALEAAIFETSKHNKNLTASQRELLQCHFCLGHIGFSHVHLLARDGQLPVNNPKSFANCDNVKCASFQFGKASFQPTKTQTVFKYKSKEIELRKNDLVPVQWVSVDHFHYAHHGWLYNSKGRTDAKDILYGGFIFVDHASRYIQVRNQVTFSANDTIKAELI